MSRLSMRSLGFGLAFLIALLDQLSKWWVVEFVMNPPQVIPVTSFFNLVLGLNRGVSFGMFDTGTDTGRWILTALTITIAIGLAVWLWRVEKPWLAAALGLVVGGAVGNIIDRATIGAVVDFLDFHVAGYHWPAFNVADMGITCGAMVLIFDSLFGDHGDPTSSKDS